MSERSKCPAPFFLKFYLTEINMKHLDLDDKNSEIKYLTVGTWDN